MALGKFLVGLCKLGISLRRHRRSRERAKKECNQGGGYLHFKFSINSRTSRRFSGEILPGPLCAPLYCHSSLCSNKRRSRSRSSPFSLKVSAAVSASTMFGSIPRLGDASAVFTRTTLEASASYSRGDASLRR